jgi:hypothetical protein
MNEVQLSALVAVRSIITIFTRQLHDSLCSCVCLLVSETLSCTESWWILEGFCCYVGSMERSKAAFHPLGMYLEF